jgi:hypothetical protein
MRTLILAIAALPLVATTAAAEAADYAAQRSNCSPSVERWWKDNVASGRKVHPFGSAKPAPDSAIFESIVRWESGSVQQVLVMPVGDGDGNPAFCIVARRNLAAAPSS